MKSKSVTTKSSPVWLFQETLLNPLTFIVDMDGLDVMCLTYKLPDLVFEFPLGYSLSVIFLHDADHMICSLFFFFHIHRYGHVHHSRNTPQDMGGNTQACYIRESSSQRQSGALICGGTLGCLS
jgi:hypothetical protein